MEKKEKLTPRQQAFVRNITKGMSGREAAIKAGYAKSSADGTASRLLRNAKVSAKVKANLEKAAETAIVDQAFVLERLRKVAEVCSETYQKEGFSGPTFRADGTPVMRCVDAASAQAALKTIGQFLGMGKEKEEKDQTIANLAETLRGLICEGK